MGALLLAAISVLTLALTGCGSKTKTVTVTSTPPAPSGAAAKSSGSTTTAPGSTSSAPSPTTPSETRTAPEPAFAEHEAAPQAEGVSAAAALVRAQGFTPGRLSEYHSDQTLRVLVGTRTGSGDGSGQRAFFFLGSRYLGTDTKEPSATIKVVGQSDTEITIAYPLYRHDDPLCCPGGGQAIVHFQLDDGKLTALQPIPPATSSTGLSRN
jgi:LppP/LprE lipoprotein